MSVIREARSAADYAEARALFLEYAAELGLDLGFQGFTRELVELGDMYGPPGGALFLAWDGARPVGCVGTRTFAPGVGEMKRLYLRPAARGQGLGRALAQASIAAARRIGHRRLVLDTLASMHGARQLYSSLGFKETGPYYANPLPDVVYFELDLEAGSEKG